MRIKISLPGAESFVRLALENRIPLAYVAGIISLANTAYALGMADHAFREDLPPRIGDEGSRIGLSLEQSISLGFAALRDGLPKENLPGTAELFRKAYLLGYADNTFGVPREPYELSIPDSDLERLAGECRLPVQ